MEPQDQTHEAGLPEPQGALLWRLSVPLGSLPSPGSSLHIPLDVGRTDLPKNIRLVVQALISKPTERHQRDT